MRTHNICFYGEIMKIIPKLSSNTLLICSTGLHCLPKLFCQKTRAHYSSLIIDLFNQLSQTMRKFHLSKNFHPLKTAAYPMLQVPVWLCMSFSLRNMAGYRVLGVGKLI